MEEGKAALGRAELVAVSDGIVISCHHFYPISFSYGDFFVLIPWIASENCFSSQGKMVPVCSHHFFPARSVADVSKYPEEPEDRVGGYFLIFVFSLGP